MSTTFGLIIKDGYLVDIPQNIEDIYNYIENSPNIDVIEIAIRTNSGYFFWKNILASFLPDDLKVYAIDNTQQGIFTIGDIKLEIGTNIKNDLNL